MVNAHVKCGTDQGSIPTVEHGAIWSGPPHRCPAQHDRGGGMETMTVWSVPRL